jgi:hypothetical protein
MAMAMLMVVLMAVFTFSGVHVALTCYRYVARLMAASLGVAGVAAATAATQPDTTPSIMPPPDVMFRAGKPCHRLPSLCFEAVNHATVSCASCFLASLRWDFSLSYGLNHVHATCTPCARRRTVLVLHCLAAT